jgi:hypothetical protein
MISGKLEISSPKNGIQFIWKYLDLHRFIYLITEQKLFFTRLDKLDDPYEGVATSLLRNTILKTGDSIDDPVPIEFSANKKKLEYEKKLYEYIKNDEIKKSQKRQYVNCWFASDRESMAMWNLYSNEDSVAVRLNFEKVKVELKNSFGEFISQNGNRISVIGDEITYLKLNPFDESLPKQSLKYSALKKDIAFQYEMEYRFLIVTISNIDEVESFTAPININKLDLIVVTHPNMQGWKYANIEKILRLSGLKIKLERSPILLNPEFRIFRKG